MSRRYPKRDRKPPLRLVVTMDENDENEYYEYVRAELKLIPEVLATMEAVDIDGNADEDDENVDDDDEEMNDFIINDLEEDDEYVPSEGDDSCSDDNSDESVDD